ncbi:helix-turn-helix domain-containing protein [Lacrimispora sp.]|uniref:helix-turn-helix domain-containing protein n=1 Tax=Lacrimispora sp. TaxID=2719234 RepID=UPI0028AD2474|nr:helix-turn-helix transcriptional regulator [Lacrimispora sp.]
MDKFRLEYEMKSKGITIEVLCKSLGISRSAFYRKCNGLSNFTQNEIQQIVDFLGLKSPMGIFFKENVS